MSDMLDREKLLKYIDDEIAECGEQIEDSEDGLHERSNRVLRQSFRMLRGAITSGSLSSPSPAQEGLLGCPFCGGPAEKRVRKGESLWSHNIVEWTSIGCAECDFNIDNCEGAKPTSIELWNTRSHGGWIPVSERLPDMIGCYLVCRIDDDGHQEIAWSFYNSEKQFCWPVGYMQNVTHWMNLPRPPQGA